MSRQNDILTFINFIDPTDRSHPVVDQLETGVILEWLVIGVTCSHSRVTQFLSDTLE